MAAHILRVLNELKDGDCTVDEVRDGMSYALFGDNFNWNDWRILKDAEDDKQFKKLAIAMIPSYQKIWTQLGEPRTAEEWLERKNAV